MIKTASTSGLYIASTVPKTTTVSAENRMLSKPVVMKDCILW